MLPDEKPLRCVEGLVMRQREWNQNEECFRLCPHPIACQLKRRKATMNLTEHFTLEELTFSPTAERQKINNTPSLEAVAHMTTLAEGLEKVRALLGGPIRISSGYRSPELNAAIRGARNSAHMAGYAADFTCPSFGNPKDVVRAIAASAIEFDQCIYEGTWVHISFDPDMRRQVLTAHFGQGGTTYTEGV